MESDPSGETLNEMINGFRAALIAGGFDQRQIGELLLTSGGALLCLTDGRMHTVEKLRVLADELEDGFAKIS